MTAKGYKGIMVKEAVAEKVREKAKAKGKTITAFLDGLLETYDKGTLGILDLSNKSYEGIRDIMREVLDEMMRGSH